jgi:hypothetical protein
MDIGDELERERVALEEEILEVPPRTERGR